MNKRNPCASSAHLRRESPVAGRGIAGEIFLAWNLFQEA
jgi:hypothetical protein